MAAGRLPRLEAVEATEPVVALVQRKPSSRLGRHLTTPPRTPRHGGNRNPKTEESLEPAEEVATPDPVSRKREIGHDQAAQKPFATTTSCSQRGTAFVDVEMSEVDEELLTDLTQELDSLERSVDLYFPQQLEEVDGVFREMQELRLKAANSANTPLLAEQGGGALLWAKSSSAVQASHWVAAGAAAAAKTFRTLAQLEAVPSQVPVVAQEAPMPCHLRGEPVCVHLYQDEEALNAIVQARIAEVTRCFSGQSGWPERLHATVELKLLQEVRAVQENLAEARRQRQRRQELLLEAARAILEDFGRGFSPTQARACSPSTSSDGSTETLLCAHHG